LTMTFALGGAARAPKLTARDVVRFRLGVKCERSFADRIQVVSAAPVEAGLRRTPAVPAVVPVRSLVPHFALVDQAAPPPTLSSLRGKVVSVAFIYTRCPLPDYCSRMGENFRSVRDRFAGRMNRELALLTVSFDPKYGTPETLARYAASRRGGGPG